MQVHVETGAHAVLTTPGATRFYRTNGALAVQRLSAHVASGAKLEWLPLEAIAYAGCRAENHMQFNLAQGAQLMAWDVTALGLPASGLGFFTLKNIADNARGYWTKGQFSPQNAGEAPVSTQNGSFLQHLELPGLWLERGRVRADDAALQLSPVGLAGNTCMGSFVLAAGSAMPRLSRPGCMRKSLSGCWTG